MVEGPKLGNLLPMTIKALNCAGVPNRLTGSWTSTGEVRPLCARTGRGGSISLTDLQMSRSSLAALQRFRLAVCTKLNWDPQPSWPASGELQIYGKAAFSGPTAARFHRTGRSMYELSARLRPPRLHEASATLTSQQALQSKEPKCGDRCCVFDCSVFNHGLNDLHWKRPAHETFFLGIELRLTLAQVCGEVQVIRLTRVTIG